MFDEDDGSDSFDVETEHTDVSIKERRVSGSRRKKEKEKEKEKEKSEIPVQEPELEPELELEEEIKPWSETAEGEEGEENYDTGQGHQELETAHRLADKWKNFLTSYFILSEENGKKVYPYFEQIQQMRSAPSAIPRQSGTTIFYLNYEDLEISIHRDKTNELSELSDLLINQYDDSTSAIKEAVYNILVDIQPDYASAIRDKLLVVVHNTPHFYEISGLTNDDVDKVRRLEGTITQFDNGKQIKIIENGWECEEGHVTLTEGTFKPKTCKYLIQDTKGSEPCGARIVRERTDMQKRTDMCYIRIQQRQDRLREGRFDPPEIDVRYEGPEIVQKILSEVYPGQYVSIDGVVRILHLSQMDASTATIEIQGSSFVVMPESVLIEDDPDLDQEVRREIPPEEIYEHYKKLVRSIAPNLEGLEMEKQGILALLAGTDAKERKGGARFRGELNILLFGSPACVVAGTRVALGNGQLVNIESLGNAHLQNINQNVLTGEGGHKHATATVFHKYKKQNVIEIETESGKVIRGTYNHPLLVFQPSSRSFDWKRMDQISLGDKIVCINKIYSYLKNPIRTRLVAPLYSSLGGPRYHGKIPAVVDEDFASIMGYNIGDGWHRNKALGFIVSQTEEELVEPIKQMMSNVFGDVSPFVYTKIPQSHTLENGLLVGSMPMTTIEYFSNAIVQMTAFLRNKRVPDLIFRSPDTVVASFLRWLFQADGEVRLSQNDGMRGKYIALKSVRPALLRDVQLILLRFGIHSRIQSSKLVIGRSQSILRFAKHIGFVTKAKAEKIAAICKFATRYSRVGQQRTEKVSRISYLLKPEDVYDIEVPGKNRFIANGIVSHNTGKTELLKYAAKIRPRSVYVIGRSASAVGLTAGIEHVEVMRGGQRVSTKRVSFGAYALARDAIVCLDEVEKRDKNDYEDLSHPMDDNQELNVSKAGIYKRISASCGSLHAGNPTKNNGIYDKTKNFFDQVNFANWLSSRYDLIFAIATADSDARRIGMWNYYSDSYAKVRLEKDIPSSIHNIDKRQGSVYDSSRQRTRVILNATDDWYPWQYVRREMLYLRQTYHPVCQPNTPAWEMMMKFWNRYNKINLTPVLDPTLRMEANTFVPALDNRKISSIIRVSEAIARLFRSDTVDPIHMDITINLFKYSIASVIPDAPQGYANPDMMRAQLSRTMTDYASKEIKKGITERVRDYRQNLFKFTRWLDKTTWDACIDCKGTGKRKYLQDESSHYYSYQPCGSCSGTRGQYGKFRYADLTRIARDTGIMQADIQRYFTWLLKAGAIKSVGNQQFMAVMDLKDKGIFQEVDSEIFQDDIGQRELQNYQKESDVNVNMIKPPLNPQDRKAFDKALKDLQKVSDTDIY